MATRYPATLPAVAAGWWDFDLSERGGGIDDGDNPAWVIVTVTASAGEEAELRTLAVIDGGHDDLRGAVAEALCTNGTTWWVRVTFQPPR